MPKSRPPYPPELRQQMIERVRVGRVPEELSREFVPTAQSPRRRRRYGAGSGTQPGSCRRGREGAKLPKRLRRSASPRMEEDFSGSQEVESSNLPGPTNTPPRPCRALLRNGRLQAVRMTHPSHGPLPCRLPSFLEPTGGRPMRSLSSALLGAAIQHRSMDEEGDRFESEPLGRRLRAIAPRAKSRRRADPGAVPARGAGYFA